MRKRKLASAVLALICASCGFGTANHPSNSFPVLAPLQKQACSDVSTDPTEKVIWYGKSGSFDLCWTEKDFYVLKHDKRKAYFSEYAEKWFSEFIDSGAADGIYELSFSVHSIFENLVSIEVTEVITGKHAASIASKVSLITIDLSGPETLELSYDENLAGSNLRLSRVFADDQLLDALLRNREIAEALGTKGHEMPQSLSELLSRELRLRPNNVILSAYSMQKFRFDSFGDQTVEVSLELLDSYNPRRAEVDLLTITLPLGSGNRSMFDQTREDRKGFTFNERSDLFDTNLQTVFRRET